MKHERHSFAVILLFLALPFGGAGGAITGRVVGNLTPANPIGMATVLLKSNGASATTNALGQFTLNALTGIRGNSVDGQRGIRVVGQNLYFSVSDAQHVRVELLDLSGRRIGGQEDRILPAGDHVLALSSLLENGNRSELCIAKAQIGSETFSKVFVVVPASATHGSRTTSAARSSATEAAPAVVDSLIIVKSGYQTRTIPLASLATQDLGDIALTPAPNQAYKGMVLIPAKNQSFLMGFTTAEAGTVWACYVGKHKVTFTYSFYMDTTMVTQEDYLKLMGVNPSRHKTGDLKLPVEQVSWYDAAKYCNARSKRDGLDTVYSYPSGDITKVTTDIKKNGYRIVTNAEYEYTERAGLVDNLYFFSKTRTADVTTIGAAYAWYTGNSGGATHPVATKKPHPWGLYDLVGNLFEWCEDWDYTYPTTDQVDFVVLTSDGKQVCGDSKGMKKIAKGGSYKTDVIGHMRINYHYMWSPGSLAGGEIGFRCVATGR